MTAAYVIHLDINTKQDKGGYDANWGRFTELAKDIDVFEKAFAGDLARLAGRQLNLIRATCEFLYRLEQDKENQEINAATNQSNNTSEEEQ